MSAARRLDDIYNDEDQLRKEEINKIAGPNEFTEFYARLRSIREFHRLRKELTGQSKLWSKFKSYSLSNRPLLR